MTWLFPGFGDVSFDLHTYALLAVFMCACSDELWIVALCLGIAGIGWGAMVVCYQEFTIGAM